MSHTLHCRPYPAYSGLFLSQLSSVHVALSQAIMVRFLSSNTRGLQDHHVHTRLAYEWTVDGKIVSPSVDFQEKYHDREVIVFLHGLLGNAKNLRSLAKKLTARLPQLSALSLDIRGHGNSSSMKALSSFPPPHTFPSCAQDVKETLEVLGLVGHHSPSVMCGHSLGGRIALEYTYGLCHDHLSPAMITTSNQAGFDKDVMSCLKLEPIRPPKQTWILDSVPGKVHPSVFKVLNAIASIPLPISSKQSLMKTLMEQYDIDHAVAMWMVSNLKDCERNDESLNIISSATNSSIEKKKFEWIFNLEIAKELVTNFENQDFMNLIQDILSKQLSVHLVMAGKNEEWTEEIVSKLNAIAFKSPLSPSLKDDRMLTKGLFQLHKLENAGHWVHVDNLDGLLSLISEKLQK